ncbi:hypothetical protein L3Q82_007465 [Scortum barcoo]|uniref:Uncharacterized protein n=1 Tax=Scortum barcoo TaxID=214431 RepID=A0ACB8WNE2_9TELE|nr:hypothetical protein L3Q82_007465 [Scortum barcoo]
MGRGSVKSAARMKAVVVFVEKVEQAKQLVQTASLSAAQSSTGPLVGAVLGALFILILVGVLLAFLVIRGVIPLKRNTETFELKNKLAVRQHPVRPASLCVQSPSLHQNTTQCSRGVQRRTTLKTLKTTLCQLSWDRIVEVCKYLDCIEGKDDETITLKSRRALIKMAENKLDEIERDTDTEEVIQIIQELLAFIEGEADAREGGEEQERRLIVKIKEKYLELQQSRKTLEDELKMLGEKLNISEDAKVSTSQHSLPAKVPEVTIRREFRICGQIGEGGQRDKLSFTNLMHQIESGLRKGHGESEIIEAVIRAISPGLKLRDMLEIKTELTLPQLKTILKGHYKEDDTSDLYQKLINISQEPKESAQDFLFRAIELKDRLLFASKGRESEEHYSADLVKRKFLRSVATGLLSDNIKYQIKPYLDDMDVTDETLIERVNEAANLETERLNKLKRNSTKASRLNELQTTSNKWDNSHNSSAQSSLQRKTTELPKEKAETVQLSPEPEMHTLVRELKTEVAEMKRMVLASMSAGKSPNSSHLMGNKGTRKRTCKSCQDKGEDVTCSHCFKCAHSITLGPRVCLGHIESVKAVYPAAIQPVAHEPPAGPEEATEKNTDCSGINCSTTDCNEAWDPPVMLDHLSSEQQTLVLSHLVDQLSTPPILGYPDLNEPFILHTDASQAGLGAVLYQRNHGMLKVIAYGSRTLTYTRAPEEGQEEHVHMEVNAGGGEDAIATDTESSGEEMEVEIKQKEVHPQRQRRQPQTLTYDKLGQPSFRERTVFTKEVAVKPVKVIVMEDRDAILPCSLESGENIESRRFEWTKDYQKDVSKEVFMYDGTAPHQSEQFRGRVSHFPDELKNGNASIKITKTKLADGGNYTCIFPNLQPQRKFNIELVVDAILKDRSRDEITVKWQDSDGNLVPAKDPQVSERGGSYDVIILQAAVTKTDTYRCNVTQKEIHHETHKDTFVHLNDENVSAPPSDTFMSENVEIQRPRPNIRQSALCRKPDEDKAGRQRLITDINVEEVALAVGADGTWLCEISCSYEGCRCVCGEGGAGEAAESSTGPLVGAVLGALFILILVGVLLAFLVIRGVIPLKCNIEPTVVRVKEGSDAILPCLLRGENIELKLFDWRKKDDQKGVTKEVFMYEGGDHYNNGREGQDEQFRGRVSHFEGEMKNGNASIIIRNPKVIDSGNYTCDFPLLKPQKTFHIQLVVGAAPEPYVTALNETKD